MLGYALSGIASGFVQCGGAGQTAAAEDAGSRTQLTPRSPITRPG